MSTSYISKSYAHTERGERGEHDMGEGGRPRLIRVLKEGTFVFFLSPIVCFPSYPIQPEDIMVIRTQKKGET